MNQKKLYKSSQDQIFCGVCGGIAQYFNMDSTMVRLITVGIFILGVGSTIPLYVIAAVVMPSDHNRTQY